MKNENSTDNVECDITGNTPIKNEKMDFLDITNKNKIGIYKIVNKINEKYYIGGSINIERRWNEHKYDLRRNIHHNNHLQNSWNMYGENSFEFIIIDICDIAEVKLIEQRHLDIANTDKNKSYNISFIAEGGDLNEISKEKISKSLKKYYINHPEMKKHLSEVHTGIKQTEEHIRNAANAKKGINHHLYGKHLPEETRKKLSGINHPRYDYTIYKFHNILSNELFIGTKNEFYKKYNFLRQNVYPLVRGTRTSYKKWKCLNPTIYK